MKGHDYNNALTIFFVSYAGAEPVTNVLLKRLTPRVFFTGIIIMWGFTMTMMGLVTNYGGLLVSWPISWECMSTADTRVGLPLYPRSYRGRPFPRRKLLHGMSPKARMTAHELEQTR